MSEIRSEKIYKLQTASNEDYFDIIPNEMENKLISQMSETVFGVDLLEIYLDRNIFETKALILSDFASNGFFWAQIKDELLSQEYKNIYEIINSAAEEPKNKPSSLNTKWCVAKFQGEWFRAYIVQLLDNNKVRVFFIDYGSFEVIDGKDTRDLGNLTEDVLENIWALHPLALPCVLKNLRVSQIKRFRELQYETFMIKSIKLIEKSYIFEVELMLESGETLVNKI